MKKNLLKLLLATGSVCLFSTAIASAAEKALPYAR